MVKNILLLIFGLGVTIAGAIQAFRKGIFWTVFFWIFWLLLFVYSWRHHRLRAHSATQEGNMPAFLKITSPDGLGSVHDMIHDCFFDVEDISFDPTTSVLSFRFRRPASGHSWSNFVAGSTTSPAIAYYLRIHHVESYSINDTRKIGTYDFNVLKYNTSTRCITVLTNIPIDIQIIVRDFELSVEQADNAFAPRRGGPK
jgi:hypothetical protein